MQPYFFPFNAGKFAMIDLGSAQSVSLLRSFHDFLSVGRFSETGAEAEVDEFDSPRRVAFRRPLDSSAYLRRCQSAGAMEQPPLQPQEAEFLQKFPKHPSVHQWLPEPPQQEN
jgi:hypothetical protein